MAVVGGGVHCAAVFHVVAVIVVAIVGFGSASVPHPHHANGSAEGNETTAVALITTLLNRSDSRVRPGVYGPATLVTIDFFVQSFGPLNEQQMSFEIDVDFRETWVDPRLTFESADPDTPVFIPHHNIDKFWIPDVYFPNEKSGTTHALTLPNKSIRIYPNGTVRYFSRMAMTVSCTMFLNNFPLDSQICKLKISTYSYDERQVNLTWDDSDPIEIKMDELNLPQYQMTDHNADSDCDESYKTGKYSCLQAKFILTRKVGFFVLQTYIPSMLIVMLSWVGFWINKNSEPARVALGVTTVLTMTTQLTSSASNTMRVSYPKALDVWYSACMVFVFGALLEFAFVNVFTRSEKRLSSGDGGRAHAPESPTKSDVEGQKSGGVLVESATKCKECLIADRLVKLDLTAKKIDRMSRKVFPLCFFIFNFCYWIFYTVIFADTRRVMAELKK